LSAGLCWTGANIRGGAVVGSGEVVAASGEIVAGSGDEVDTGTGVDGSGEQAPTARQMAGPQTGDVSRAATAAMAVAMIVAFEPELSMVVYPVPS
jgi:hypothetical protein